MQAMSDEELDRMFREKLQSYETEPSARVWQNISGDLRPESSKKGNTQRIWMAAASLIAFAMLGLLLLPGKPPVKLQASTVAEPVQPEPAEPAKPESSEVRESKSVRFLERLASMKVEGNKHVANYKVRSKAISENIAHISQVQPLEAQSPLGPTVDMNVSVQQVVITEQQAVKEPAPAPVLAASMPGEENRSESKSKIRSVGDIVNFVVRQVDPRRDKLIEFTSHDDGTTVSSINLGVLKIRTKQNDPKLN